MILSKEDLPVPLRPIRPSRSPAFHGKLRAIQERAVAKSEVCVEKCDECRMS